MLNWIKAQFQQEDNISSGIDIELAACCLLVEIMVADHKQSPEEEEFLFKAVQRLFDLEDEVVKEIVSDATKQVDSAHDAYQYTGIINQHWKDKEKRQLLVELWRLALSDHHLDKYEEHTIRKFAELLHLHHSDFIQAKLTAQNLMK